MAKVKVPVTLQLVVLTLGLTGLYTMVGQTVPQKEVHPPEVIEIAKDVSPEEMAAIGKEIFEGKGICHTCHTIGKSGALRFPDLAGVDTRAANRIPGYSDVDYFADSLYQPNDYIVEGFSPGMPTINKPPIGLTDDEILCVIAYLQTLGGTPTVTMETKHAFNGGTLSSESGGGGEAVAATGGEAGAGEGSVLETRGCVACHATAADGDASKAATFPSIGARLDRDQLAAGLVYHPGDVGSISQEDIKALVAAMTELKGQG